MFELPDMENVIKVTVDSPQLKVLQNPLSHMVKNHQHQLLKLNLFLEISIIIAILINNESFIFKTSYYL